MPISRSAVAPALPRRGMLRSLGGLGLYALSGEAGTLLGAGGRPRPTYDLAKRIRTGRMTAVCLEHSA